jgi:hypothetical protein
MLIQNFGILAVSTALLGNIGCDKPGAAEEQKENSAIQQDLRAQDNAAQQSAQAQADMRDKVAAARADFDKARDDYRRTRQADLKELDGRISKLEERAASTTGSTHAKLDQALATIRVQRSAFASDVREIDNVAATNWDQFKSKTDDDYNALRDRLDKAS